MVKNKVTTVAKKKKSVKSPRKIQAAKSKPQKVWVLRLYIAGQTPKCLTAFNNLKKFGKII